MGRIVCCKCGKVKGYDPRIKGDSHGYCETCFEIELKKVDELIARKQAEKEQKENDGKK